MIVTLSKGLCEGCADKYCECCERATHHGGQGDPRPDGGRPAPGWLDLLRRRCDVFHCAGLDALKY